MSSATAWSADQSDGNLDVLVVGGGPAGSTTAGLLARRGWRVAVLDRARFPRPKACGECLNPGAVRALRRLGLLDRVLGLDPAMLTGWTIHAAARTAEGRFGGGLWGLGVPRLELDAALLEAARVRGAAVWEGIRVTGVTPPAGPAEHPRVAWRAEDGRSGTLTARVVVGADGLRSVVSRSLGLVARRPELRKVSLTCRVAQPGPAPSMGQLHVADGVTVGLAPVRGSGGLLNATVVAEAPRWGRALSADAVGFVQTALARSCGPDPRRRIVGGPWASGPFDWPVRHLWAPGVVLVGDAAGYFDPFTGQGIHRALRSAELAAEAVDATLGSRAPSWRALRSYGRALAAEFRGGRRLQYLVEAVMARPRVRVPVLDLLARGGALDQLIRVTGDAASASTLLRPGWWGVALVRAVAGRAPC